MAVVEFQEILELIDTKYQADEFVNQLNVLIDALYEKNVDVVLKIKLLLPSPKSEHVITLIQQERINLNDAVRIQSLLQDIKDAILNIPIVNIVVPFEAKEDDLKRLSAWFNVNLQKKIIPKITVDKTLIGGATIGFKGVHRDYSIMTLLEEKYQKGELNKFIDYVLAEKNAAVK